MKTVDWSRKGWSDEEFEKRLAERAKPDEVANLYGGYNKFTR